MSALGLALALLVVVVWLGGRHDEFAGDAQFLADESEAAPPREELSPVAVEPSRATTDSADRAEAVDLARRTELSIVVVAARTREPIVAAKVEWWEPGAGEPLAAGATGAKGELSLGAAAHESGSFLRVEAAGFALKEQEVPPSEPLVVTIAMVDGGVLAGRVVRASGAPWSGRVRIAATPRSAATWGDIDVGPATRFDRLRTVECELDGRFRIDGLPIGVTYQLTVAGGGFARCSLGDRFVVPNEAIELAVAPLHAACFEFVDAQGGPLRSSPELPIVLDGWETEPIGDAQLISKQHPTKREAALAGVPTEQLRRLDSHRWMHLVVIESDESVAARYRVSATPPGYRWRRFEGDYRRLDQPPVFDRVEFERVVDGFGEVEVRFEGAGVRDGATCNGKLFLRSRDDRSPMIELETVARAQPPLLITGVPHGLYDSGFSARMWSAEPLPRLFAVGPTRAVLTVATKPSASLRVSVGEVDGLPYLNQLHLQLRPAGTTAGSMWPETFYEPPFRIEGLRAGSWDLLVRPAFPLLEGEEQDQLFRGIELVEGAECVVELAVGPRLR